MPIVFGKNPVLEALKTDRPIDKIFIQSGKEGVEVGTIYKIAKQKQPDLRGTWIPHTGTVELNYFIGSGGGGGSSREVIQY